MTFESTPEPHADNDRHRADAQRVLHAVAGELHSALSGREILCFANDWKGDPTSKHHVMRTLAEHVPVTWVESSGMRRPRLLDPSDLRRIAGKLRRAGGPAPDRSRDPVTVVTPLAVPLPGSALADRLNRVIYRRAIRKARGGRDSASRSPLRWVYTPTVEPLLDGLPGEGLVYHCVDRWWEFSEYDGELMRRCHERLCRRADVVFASAQALLDDCAPHTDRAHLMRHGVDWEHFAGAALQPPATPADIADVEGPIVGFFGLIHDWIDLDLIGAVADRLPGATVVLLGKARVDVSELAGRSNVRLLGQKPYEVLPAYAARFTVGLIPFVVNELTQAVNPIKLREYLAAGLPVVSTPLPELVPFESHPRVRMGRDGHAFVEAVRAIVEAPPDRKARVELARSMVTESWTGKTAEMIRLWLEATQEG